LSYPIATADRQTDKKITKQTDRCFTMHGLHSSVAKILLSEETAKQGI